MSQKIYLGSDFLPCSLEDTDTAHEHSALQATQNDFWKHSYFAWSWYFGGCTSSGWWLKINAAAQNNYWTNPSSNAPGCAHHSCLNPRTVAVWIWFARKNVVLTFWWAAYILTIISLQTYAHYLLCKYLSRFSAFEGLIDCISSLVVLPNFRVWAIDSPH